MVPGDSLAISSIDVGVLRDLKELEMIPWEIISAVGKNELGIDPLLIETVDMVSGMPSINGPEFGIVIKTKTDVDIEQLNDKLMSETTRSPKNKEIKIRALNEAPVKVVQTDPKTILVGSEGTLRRMMGNKVPQGKAIELLSASKLPMRSITSLATLRPLAEGALSDAGGMIPAPLIPDLETVIEQLEYIQTGSNLGILGGLSSDLSIKLIGKDADSTKKLFDAINRLRKEGLDLLDQYIQEQMENEKEMPDDVRAAIKQYVARMKSFLEQAEALKLEGNEIALNAQMAYSVPTIGILTGLLLPAVQAAREAARRMQSTNNLRQLGLAILNYESAYRQLPSRAVVDKKGTPLLSWRVTMLPYLEQQELYNEFHQDEPWDSDHNIKLLDRMPALFTRPGFEGPPGHTPYLATYKKGSVWTLAKPRLRDITDGTSNTIAVIEVSDENAVPWTKPDDLDLDAVDAFDFMRDPVSHVLFFDCSVRAFPAYIGAAPGGLDPYVTSNGGEVNPELP
jgi:hypothetical protein